METILQHKPLVIWFTGLSGAGKSTLAESLARYLKSRDLTVCIYDGDVIRNLKKNSGFSKQDRIEHNRQIISSVKEESRFDVILVATICPYESIREECRNNIKNYFEVYVSTPLQVCESRDVKGLYKKARRGEIQNFTGIGDPFEIPQNPDLVLDTSHQSLQSSLEALVGSLNKAHRL